LNTHADSSSPASPCPHVFRYELDRYGDWYGLISVPNPYPVVAIDIRVELYITAVSLVNFTVFNYPWSVILSSMKDRQFLE
jgi:hypothetical protein